MEYSITCLDNNTANKFYIYRGLNNNDRLLFNELISINPHNINIYSVRLHYCRNDTGELVIRLLYRSDEINYCCIKNIKKDIESLASNYELDENMYNEIHHVVNLWLTKFVPDVDK